MQNRYKLNKKCRQLAEAVARDPDNLDLRRAFAETKVSLSEIVPLHHIILRVSQRLSVGDADRK